VEPTELLYFHRLWLIGPMPAEQVPLVLGGHGAEQNHAHNQEDQEEYDGNYEDWHTSPLF